MRAVYYCRVSTDEETQLNALERQIQEARGAIAEMGWELAGGYVDEGRSGTTVKKRDGYRRLFDALDTDEFEVIVIKSQDRLMRNAREWYVFIDALVKNGKKLFFYLESRFYTPDDALLTGVKAILAEEYSRELSRKIRNAHKRRQETGETVLITSNTWGYDKVGKRVVVNEEEAAVVRLIYDLSIMGHGSRLISKELYERGIRGRTGRQFPEVTVRRIIRNPLFMGTAVMNRRSSEFDTKKITVNPSEDWKVHENAVPSIVSRDTWEKANQRMDERMGKVRADGRRIGRNTGRHILSGKVICGVCGAPYWRRQRRNGGGAIAYWSCAEYVRRGRKGCLNAHISEAELMKALSENAEHVPDDERRLAAELAADISREVLYGGQAAENQRYALMAANIARRMDTLTDRLLDGTLSKAVYKSKSEELAKRLCEINEARSALAQGADMSGVERRLSDIADFLRSADIGGGRVLRLIGQTGRIIVSNGVIELILFSRQNLEIQLT